MFPTLSFRVAALSLMAAVVSSSIASAEVVPNADCKDCRLVGQYASDADDTWTTVQTVCERTKSFAIIFPGVPTSGVAGYQDCINCPSSNGHECEPGVTGPSLDCSINISATITISVTVDFTASGGIDVGVFNNEFEAHVGSTASHSTTVECTGAYSTPYCKKAKIKGTFDQVIGRIGRVTVTHTKRVTQRSTLYGNLSTLTYACRGGSADITFDSNAFNTAISVESLNDCSYVPPSGDDGDGSGNR